MAEIRNINLLEAISEHSDYYAAIFLTYGADLAFYEETILGTLWRQGCRKNLIFMDAARYADTARELGGSITWAGVRYIPIPVSLDGLYSFHPKVVLLLGENRGRLLIGSGNLTFPGYGHNHEVFTCIDWIPSEPVYQALFGTAWHLVNEIFHRWGRSSEAQRILNMVPQVVSWITERTDQSSSPCLLHTLDEPLINQCAQLLVDEDVETLKIVTPFLDESASALSELYKHFKPREIHLFVQNKRAVGNLEQLDQLKKEGIPLRIFSYSETDRYLHAKIYLFQTARTHYFVTGSANCTRAAWLATPRHGNVEVALLTTADANEDFEDLFEYLRPCVEVTSTSEITFRQESSLL